MTAQPIEKIEIWPGILACLALGTIAYYLGLLLPIVGGPVLGILLGIAVATTFTVPNRLKPGLSFTGKKILQLSIIVMGGSLDIFQIAKTGYESAGVMILTITVALLAAYFIGRLLNVCNYLIALVGVGTGICGGSAIAAIAPIIKAHDDDIAFSMATVFLFNIAAVIIFPVMGHALHLSDTGFGLWAGTAINDTSSVVAAAYSYSKTAGDYATITKLARTTMIIPIALGLAVFMSTRRKSLVSVASLTKIIPWFILGFVAFACINSTGLLPAMTANYCGNVAKFLIVIALTGIGLNANLRNLIKTGPRPILLGLLVWACVAVTSLMIQRISGRF